MDFSPTRQSEVAACEKLRDTVHSISALHSSMLEGARTPTPKNSFLELYQMSTYAMAKKKDELDVEHPLPTDKNVIPEQITPPTKLPHPVMLKIKKNFREQMKLITNKFPNLRNRTVGDVVKMFTNDHEEYRSLIQYLKTDIEFKFYVIDNKKEKPIKVVIKGHPSSSKIEDITSDLADEGYKIESCTQLTSKRTKKKNPPLFLSNSPEKRA
ncbi:hypothetical protein TNCV_433831 [Trichonephila clavipes]|nr:hypothetical protein TNCV_433831 [Trichonephila clavipes]